MVASGVLQETIAAHVRSRGAYFEMASRTSIRDASCADENSMQDANTNKENVRNQHNKAPAQSDSRSRVFGGFGKQVDPLAKLRLDMRKKKLMVPHSLRGQKHYSFPNLQTVQEYKSHFLNPPEVVFYYVVKISLTFELSLLIV